MKMPKDPATSDEWQEAVDMAEFFLHLHAAIAHGLLTGPEVDVDRCEEILRLGRDRGVMPRPDAVERLAKVVATGT